jgi:hypothetical protein
VIEAFPGHPTEGGGGGGNSSGPVTTPYPASAVAAAPPAKPAVPSSPAARFLGFAGSPLGAGVSGRVAGGRAGHGGVGAPRTPSLAIMGAEAAGADAAADDDAMSDKIDEEIQAELQKQEEEEKKKEPGEQEEESDDGSTQAVREGSELNTAIEKHYGTFGAGTHHFEILDHKHMTQIGRGLYGVPCTLCRRIPADLNKKNATTVFRVLKSAHPGARVFLSLLFGSWAGKRRPATQLMTLLFCFL